MKTIKEIAEEMGITSQAVLKRINNLPDELKPSKVAGKYVIDIKTEEIIKGDSIKKTTEKQPNIMDDFNKINDIIKLLENQLNLLNNQLQEKDTQIAELHKLMDHQQQLNLTTTKSFEKMQDELKLAQKQLVSLESIDKPKLNYISNEYENKDKVENINKEKTNKEKTNNVEKSNKENVENTQEINKKKWWKFWNKK